MSVSFPGFTFSVRTRRSSSRVPPRGNTREELRRVLTDKVKPGKETEIVVLRKGERVTLKATWSD